MTENKNKPQMNICDMHASKIKDMERTLYDNAKGLKTRVNVLESNMDNLARQNSAEHNDIKKVLSRNTWAIIGFCVTIIFLLISALVALLQKGG